MENNTAFFREDCRLGRIYNVLDELGDEFIKLSDLKRIASIHQLRNNYNLLVDYFEAGVDDPLRADVLAKIYDEIYSLISIYERKVLKKKAGRKIADIPHTDLPKLFEAIENNYPATQADRQAIHRLIMDESNPLYIRAMALSALTLNLMYWFDNDKFESLYTYTLSDQPSIIRARAWVGIVLVAMANDHRISTQPRLVEHLKFVCEEGISKENGSPLLFVQHHLIQCRLAAKPLDIIKQIIPKIEKGLSSVKDSIKEDEDIEPRWMEFMDKSGINDNLREFADMQMDGVDIMYDSFTKLCRIPFFNTKCNWFIPFDLEWPDLTEIFGKSKARQSYFKLISKAANMSNTDKFSNLAAISFLTDSNLKEITDHLKASGLQLNNTTDVTDEDEIITYLHDIYRYFNIFCKKNCDDSLFNPFNTFLYFGKFEMLASVVADNKLKFYLGDKAFNSENWREAAVIYNDIVNIDPTEENLQKLIHSRHKILDNYTSILHILEKCNRLYPDNKWTIKHYAQALSENCHYEQEENVLREAIEHFPDNVTFIVMLGENLMNQERYQEAIEMLFKADLMKENSYRTVRLIAETAMMLGNKKVATKYIDMTLNSPKAVSADWIIGGHIALINGDLPLALTRYRKADPTDITEDCLEDDATKLLIKLGVPKDVATLAFEVVIRDFNNELPYNSLENYTVE